MPKRATPKVRSVYGVMAIVIVFDLIKFAWVALEDGIET